MPAITEIARAKVNLTLKVRGADLGPDGYHELDKSRRLRADLGDIVRLVPGEAGCSIRGPFASSIEGDNLIETTLRTPSAEPAPTHAARSCAREVSPRRRRRYRRGPTDAAALLRTVRFANGSRSLSIDWAGIAASLGADVPVCFLNRAAFVTGMGERSRPFPICRGSTRCWSIR